MLAEGIITLILKIFSICLNIIPKLLKLLWGLGFGWFLIGYVVPALVFHYDSNFLFILFFSISLLQLLLNIILRIKKKTPKNLFIFMATFLVDVIKKMSGLDTSKGHVSNDKSRKLSGVFFGKNGIRYVTKQENTDGHILCIGGPGSGKTSCEVIPTLMTYGVNSKLSEEKLGTVFAVDIKGELYEKTVASGKRLAEKTYRFNPSDKNSNIGFNPFFIFENCENLVSASRELSIALIPIRPSEREPFWKENAQNLLAGEILFLHSQNENFSSAMKIIKSTPVNQLILEIMQPQNLCEESKMLIAEFSTMAQSPDNKTLASINSEVQKAILPFATDPLLQESLNGEKMINITPQYLEEGYDIFFQIDEHRIEQWKSLIAMTLNLFFKKFEQRKNDSSSPILFIVDEFPRLGKINIENALSTLRSKGIQIYLVCQSKAQLDDVYGDKPAIIIADNCNYKVILQATEPTTQKWCADLVGKYDKQKTSDNYNADAIGIGKGTGITNSTTESYIIRPEDFGYLAKYNSLIYLSPNGYRKLKKISYYKEPIFAK